MSLSTQSYKGARDFYPEEKQFQNWMFERVAKTYKSFGYQEYDAPILEPTDLYLAKGNAEIIEEQTYTFEDRGGRSVTVRTEMTPSVARLVAGRRQELGYPLRLCAIPELWRYERMQRGRGRQFWQPNADLFGVSSIDGDYEIMMLARQVFIDFGATETMFEVLYSSRQLIDELLIEQGIEGETKATFVRLIDRMKKISPEEFSSSMLEVVSGDASKSEYLVELFKTSNLEMLSETIKSGPGMTELKSLQQMIKLSNAGNVKLDMSIMRGFDYYTGIVFEVMDVNPENNRSMGGGGRYDGLVGLFGVEPVPTVGYAMGDMTLELFLKANNLIPTLPPRVDVRLILTGVDYSQTLPLQTSLRAAGLSVDVDSADRKLEKCFKAVDKSSIANVIVVGQDELDSGRFKIKGDETLYELADLITELRN
jgi:histidyl-tRNA synthetase